MTCKEIKQYLDKESGLDISTKRRTTEYIKYRCMFYYLCYHYATDLVSFYKLGRIVKKDHAAVYNGLKTHESFAISDASYKKCLNQYEMHVKANTPKDKNNVIEEIKNTHKITLYRRISRLQLSNTEYRRKQTTMKRQLGKLVLENQELKEKLKKLCGV